MSDTFDPGPGWRKTDGFEADNVKSGPDPRVVEFWDGRGWTYWVREVPVPLLPTQPYTVIRVTWDDGAETTEDLILSEDDGWVNLANDHPLALGPMISFEILSEPRAVTAKAVLLAAWDEIRGDDSLGGDVWDAFGGTAREFGVTS